MFANKCRQCLFIAGLSSSNALFGCLWVYLFTFLSCLGLLRRISCLENVLGKMKGTMGWNIFQNTQKIWDTQHCFKRKYIRSSDMVTKLHWVFPNNHTYGNVLFVKSCGKYFVLSVENSRDLLQKDPAFKFKFVISEWNRPQQQKNLESKSQFGTSSTYK